MSTKQEMSEERAKENWQHHQGDAGRASVTLGTLPVNYAWRLSAIILFLGSVIYALQHPSGQLDKSSWTHKDAGLAGPTTFL